MNDAGGPAVRGRPSAGLLLVCLMAVAPCAGAAQDFAALSAAATEARNAERLSDAIPLYQKAVGVKPDWAEGWWYLGTLQYDRDDYADAAAALSRAAALRPKDAAAALMLGLSEAKLGRRAEALRHLAVGRSLGFTNDASIRHVVLFTEGTLRLESGEFGKAEEALETLAREGAAQEELIVALGEAVLGVRPDAAAAADARTREIVRRAGWAEHFAAQGNFANAQREYAALAADAGKSHDVQFAYGRFLLAHHEDDQAVAAFRREIENTPKHLLARLGIAGIKLATDPAAGLPYAEQAVALAPRLAEPHYLLGAILLDMGQTDRAIAELENARRIDGADARIYFKLSRAYARAGRRDDAARANAAFNRFSEHPEAPTQE